YISCLLLLSFLTSLPLLFFLLITRHLPSPTLFPYTTLFRSGLFTTVGCFAQLLGHLGVPVGALGGKAFEFLQQLSGTFREVTLRSEEHTSELQSPDHLVCRLLLEKKNTKLDNMLPSFHTSRL